MDYYGALTPLKQLAGVSTPDASTILISPFDTTSIKGIEKAINESDVSAPACPPACLMGSLHACADPGACC